MERNQRMMERMMERTMERMMDTIKSLIDNATVAREAQNRQRGTAGNAATAFSNNGTANQRYDYNLGEDTPFPRQSREGTRTPNWAQMQQMGRNVMADGLETHERQRGTAGNAATAFPNNSTANQHSDGNFGEDTRTPNWRDAEVGFFNPDLHPRDTEDGVGRTYSNDAVYNDVHTFIDRLKDAASYRGERIVKQQVPALLRGTAQTWYSTGLSQTEKDGLRAGPIQNWYHMLRDQFRRPLNQAMTALMQERYTLQNARDRRPVASYVFSIIRHARDAGFQDSTQQLEYAYQNLHATLRQGVSKPSGTMNVSNFVKELQTKEDSWPQLAEFYSRMGSGGIRPQGNQNYRGQMYGRYSQRSGDNRPPNPPHTPHGQVLPPGHNEQGNRGQYRNNTSRFAYRHNQGAPILSNPIPQQRD